jgi:hypothetical protein
MVYSHASQGRMSHVRIRLQVLASREVPSEDFSKFDLKLAGGWGC